MKTRVFGRIELKKLLGLLLGVVLALPANALTVDYPTEMEVFIGGIRGGYSLKLNEGKLSCSLLGAEKSVPVPMAQPSAAAWGSFRTDLNKLKVWRWKRYYTNPDVNHGLWWQAKIRYNDAVLESAGDTAFPEENGDSTLEYSATFARFRAAVRALSNGCPI